jgi:hypothetical protein
VFGVLLEEGALTEDVQEGVLKDLCAGQELSNHLVLTAYSQRVYMGCVSIYSAWKEENSATIDAQVCCWLITRKTEVQPDRMQKR